MEKEQEMKSETMITQMIEMDEAAAASHAAYLKVVVEIIYQSWKLKLNCNLENIDYIFLWLIKSKSFN